MNSRIVPFFKPRARSVGHGGVKLFEQEFKNYFKHSQAVALSCGTAGLRLALQAVGLQAGQGVLVPTWGVAVTAEVVRYFDAHPILVDCREEDFNLDVADAERRLLEANARGIKVVAIIPFHFAGQIGDVTGVRMLAEKYGLKIIEDATHCCPAFYREEGQQRWETVGTGADICCFSFAGNTPITTGDWDGGMVCTNGEEYAAKMRGTENMSDAAAAEALEQLRQADEMQMLRTQVADQYDSVLSDIEELILPRVHPDRVHSWNLYVVRLQTGMVSIDRDGVMQELREAGITTSVHYLPLHMHRYYREKFGYSPEDFPCAGQLSQEVISLPMYPDMSMEEVDYVAENLRDVIRRNRKSIPFSLVLAGGWE